MESYVGLLKIFIHREGHERAEFNTSQLLLIFSSRYQTDEQIRASSNTVYLQIRVYTLAYIGPSKISRRRFFLIRRFLSKSSLQAGRPIRKAGRSLIKEINPEINFEEGPPGEEAIVIFFKHLRLYAMAGIELVPVPAPVPEQERIESTIRQAMSSVPTLNGATVNVKIVVLNDNSGNLTF